MPSTFEISRTRRAVFSCSSKDLLANVEFLVRFLTDCATRSLTPACSCSALTVSRIAERSSAPDCRGTAFRPFPRLIALEVTVTLTCLTTSSSSRLFFSFLLMFLPAITAACSAPFSASPTALAASPMPSVNAAVTSLPPLVAAFLTSSIAPCILLTKVEDSPFMDVSRPFIEVANVLNSSRIPPVLMASSDLNETDKPSIAFVSAWISPVLPTLISTSSLFGSLIWCSASVSGPQTSGPGKFCRVPSLAVDTLLFRANWQSPTTHKTPIPQK